MDPERGLQPRICGRSICADDFTEGTPNADIIVSKGSVSNVNTGGDGSGQGDVRIKVFIDGDVA